MLLEQFASQQPILLEWGRREFPGYGRRLFGQRHYQYMVMQLNHVADAHARQWLTEWLSELFQRDNPRFKPYLFAQAVAERRQYRASPRFEQRHFYYLAQAVREIQDQHVHDFVRDWLADVIGGTNYGFKRDVWNEFCTRNRVKPTVEEPPETAQITEYGARSHGGFGERVFKRAHLMYIAERLRYISDNVVRDHLIQWFMKVFKLDNPDFNAEAFQQAVNADHGYEPRVIFEARHFFFLAHEVAEIPDIHERTFVCDWLADQLGRTNNKFNDETWRKYCHLPAEDWRRGEVAHNRAKARGDEVIPEHPYDAMRRKREQSTVVTPEEFNQHAVLGEDPKDVAGHELVYLRNPKDH
jgi:hypothetical protein